MHEPVMQPTAMLPLESIDSAYLAQLLRDVGYRDTVVAGFSREPVGGPSHGGGQLHRFRLTLEPHTIPDGPAAPTSLILKEARAMALQAGDPAYFRREYDCYQHHLFTDLCTHLCVPAVYQMMLDTEASRCRIWLEDCGDAFDVAWTPPLLAQAVRDLAELHARWWGRDQEIARMPFLRHRAQAMYDGLWSDRIQANCAAIDGHAEEASIAHVFTPERRRILVRLSRAADLMYPHLERLPQTLLHQDVWLANLGRHGGRTVLIDWSYTGPGTPGVELSQMAAILLAMWGPNLDDPLFVEALHAGLTADWGCTISYEEVLAGFELGFCLRPAHILGGPILGGILSGRAPMVGSGALDDRLAAAEATWRRIERGLRRIEA